jgi:hypothetical protein
LPHIGINLPRPGNIGVASGLIAFPPLCQAAVVAEIGIPWIQFSSLVAVLNGAIIFALVVIGQAAAVKGQSQAGSEIDGLIIVLDGQAVFALVVVSNLTRAHDQDFSTSYPSY